MFRFYWKEPEDILSLFLIFQLMTHKIHTQNLNIFNVFCTGKRMMGNLQSGKQITWETLREGQFWTLLILTLWPESLRTSALVYPVLPAQSLQGNIFIMIMASVSSLFLIHLGRCLEAWPGNLSSHCLENTEQGYDK